MIERRTIESNSTANAYFISDGRTPILIECGVRFRELQKALNFKIASLAGCLLSHEHMDHAKEVKNLIKSGIDIYTSSGTAKALGISGHRVKVIRSMKQFNIETWAVLPFDTVHDCSEPLGFLLSSGEDKILFATDTAYLTYRYAGLTHVMIECNYQADILASNVANGTVSRAQRDRLLWSHFNLNNIINMLKANDLSKLREIYLMHLSNNNSDATYIKRTISKITGKPVYVCGE